MPPHTASSAPVAPSAVAAAGGQINHKVKIFLPCHYDLSQVEFCAPFLDRYGGVVFVYDWNAAKDTITDYYRRQYPDGWVKVMSFSLRNIMYAIKNLDHRLDRFDRSGIDGSNTTYATYATTTNNNNSINSLSRRESNGSIHSLASVGSTMNVSKHVFEPKKQHQVVFLLTGSMNPDHGVFNLTQKKILDAVKDALPERVRAVNVIGHCMYGCAFCSGVEHKVPLYFTRYFNKTLPYTAQDVRLLYASNRTGSASNSTNAVLVAPSYGSTSILAQKPLIQLLHRLEQTGRWRFIWKMHPSFLQLDGHNIEDESDVDQRERENVKFVLANFTVAQAEHASLLPFLEAFDVIITDLHSCVPFIATYFTPKVILSYFNDADYGAPERHKEFMSQLTTFVEPEELEGLLNTLPPAKGDPSFFHSQYGHVDGKEDLRFGNLAGWPTEQFEPSQPLQYRQVMARIALEWKRIYKDTAEKYSNDIKGANNALGFHAKFPLLKDDEDESVPITLPRLLPRDRQAAGIELRIMTFNIWNGGLSGGQPLEQTAKAILASGADVVGLQGIKVRMFDCQVRSNIHKYAVLMVFVVCFLSVECSTVVEPSGCRRYMLPELMQYLPGWYYSDQKLRSFSTGRRNPWGVVSKFPIVSATEKGFGVKIQLNNHRHPEIESPYFELPEDQYPPVERSRRSSMSSASISSFTSSGRRESSGSIHMTSNTRFMYLFNCHLYYFPYQPFQLLKIPYEGEPDLETAEEAIQSCIDTRGKEMDIILDEIKQVAEQEKDVPIFLTGDFNEPSHLDWTALSVLAGLHPMTVKWPITERAYKAGLVDLWRAYRPYQMGSGCTLPPSPVTLGSSVQFPNSGVKDAREKDQIDSQVIERPGFTWTVLKSEADVRDHCDRIDYIFGLNRESSPIALKEMAIRMGEEPCRSGEKNEKMLRPWPSDHRAVVATVLL